MSGADILVAALLLAALIPAARSCVHRAKRGGSCGCGCASCPQQCKKDGK